MRSVGGGRGGSREGHHVAVRFHGKGGTLKKWVESRSPEAGFPWKGISLFQGGLSLEGEAGQAEVASALVAAVAVKPRPAEALRVGGPGSPSRAPV